MGRLMLLLPSLLLLVLITIACAGDGDGEDPNRVLKLGMGSITEEDFRAGIRALSRGDPREMEKLCDQILLEQIGDVAILDAVRELGLRLATVTAAEPVPTDITRGAEIVREECARLRNI